MTAVTSTMFLKSFQKSSLLGQAMNRAIASMVNQAVQLVSMTKKGSRKFGVSSPTQCDLANVGSVSTQKSMMDTTVMMTDRIATTKAARDVSGYSNNCQILIST